MTIETLYELYLQHPQVTTDSRVCPADSIFFALKGDNFNGNRYAVQAIEKGCACAIVDEQEYADGKRIFLVDNVLETLQALAHHHRLMLGLPVIGITGTNGKTTTKELLAAVLGSRFRVHCTRGNLNNHIGVPLTLLGLTAEHQIAIVEMGANHPGEIKMLSEIAVPNAGLITNVGKAHLEGFGSLEGVIKTKSELYDFLRCSGGQAFVNADNPVLVEKSEGIDRLFYALENKHAFVCGQITGNSPFLSMTWQRQGEKEHHSLQTQLIGGYNAENVMAAVCVGSFFGIEAAAVCRAINEYAPANSRSQLVETVSNRLIVDAYNANPTSMRAAILNFARMQADNKTLILGDMRELGSDSVAEHRAVVDLITQNGFEHVFLIGECFGKTGASFPHFPDAAAFVEYLRKNPIKNATVLLKGSNGIRMESLVDNL